MEKFFALDYPGGAFSIFGLPHWVAMGVAAVVGFVYLRSGLRTGPDRRALLRRVLGLVILVNETGWHVWAIVQGHWGLNHALPFQMCSAMAWVTGFALVFDTRRVYPLVYFFGVAGAIQGVLQPDAGAFGFPHYVFFETMASHSMLVVGGLWVVLVERIRPTFRTYWLTLVGLNAYALVMYFTNRALGSNYLFVNAKPPGASIVDLMPEWPWYIAVLEVVAILLFGALYLPFAASRQRA